MRKNKIEVFLMIMFIAASFCSCKPKVIGEKVDQGIILYEIAYKNNSGRPFPIQLLPKTLEMKFNSDFASYTMEDPVGFFSIRSITDLNTHNNKTLIKVFDKKYVFIGESSDPPLFFNKSKTYRVKLLPDTCRLAGFLCRKATVEDLVSSHTFGVLYSPDASIRNPNNNTPYEDIDGLLMQFGIQMKNLDMNLTAKEFNPKNILNSEFEIPDGYKCITRGQMEEIIKRLLP